MNSNTNTELSTKHEATPFAKRVLAADAVYLPEFQYEELNKFLFFSVGRKIIQKIFGSYETL